MRRAAAIPILLIAILSALITACGDDSGETRTEDTSSRPTTSVDAAASPTATDSDPEKQVDGVAWPPADGSVSYADPVAAATGFATDLVGFTDPVVGEFQQGDSRSGEVPVRPGPNGPVTTVLVRQVGPGEAWSVLGAVTAGIVPSVPASGATVTSPVTLSGTSTAFEGTVQVAIHARASGAPLGTGFVTGGSMGEMGPYEGSVEFATPSTADGSIVFTTVSMEDGRVWEAAVVPVAFARE